MFSVNGDAVHSEPRKLADVETGLVVKVDGAMRPAVPGRHQGMRPPSQSITEGFALSFTNDDDHDMLEVNFSGIPDGVTVMITHIANNTEDGTDNGTPDTKKVTLTSDATAPTGDETMVKVELDDDGDGDITYAVTNADTGADAVVQANMLMVSFTWEEDTMIADGMVERGFRKCFR